MLHPQKDGQHHGLDHLIHQFNMKIENIQLIVIKPENGNKLIRKDYDYSCSPVFSDEVCLSSFDSSDNWMEITEREQQEILNKYNTLEEQKQSDENIL